MRVVIALGGNALLQRGEQLTAEVQRANVAGAARAIAEVAEEHEVMVTHGNGPQVGLLALQSMSANEAGAWPLDVLDAESAGMIGYAIEQALIPLLPGRRFATLLTQVEVLADDPAFAAPSKPVGPLYDEAEAKDLAARFGWTVGPDTGGWRRRVASPRPQRILEIGTIRHLWADGFIVICAGGGGIPVIVGPGGAVCGVEAVIDKDRTASLLAAETGADVLLLLTDVDAVYRDFGEAGATAVEEITPEELDALSLDPGSMGPKAEAAAAFVRETGGFAGIGSLGTAAEILAGRAGTRIRRSEVEGLP